MRTVFLRVLEAEDKATALLAAVREPERERGRQRFEVDAAGFAAVPRSPFAYWVSERLRRPFKELPSFETDGRTATVGLQSSDDFRFLRLWFEPRDKNVYSPFAKGGTFSPFYAELFASVDWEDDGREIKVFAETTPGSKHWSRNIRSADHYFRPGLTWPARTNGLSLRALPAGCAFGHKGPAAFVNNDDVRELLALACITNSRAFGLFVSLQLARTELAQSYEVGLIQNTPVPRLTDADREPLAQLARRAWSLKRSLDTRTEISHAFTLPALLQVAGADLRARAMAWPVHVGIVEDELASIQAEINERCFVLYGIAEADRRAISEGFGTRACEEAPCEGATDDEDDAGDNADEIESTADATVLTAELVSWAVGVAVGRFDVRLATGACPMPIEPEPFDPLPACSPGMLTGGDSLPLAPSPAGYPLALPKAGMLVDDLGHSQDLLNAVRPVFDTVFGAGAERWWNDVAALLNPRAHDLRVWLAGTFFEHHLKRYSKSRRKAPILWQLGTPSGRYSVWLYAHRLTRDTFFQLQNEVVGPKLAHEERQLTNLMQAAGAKPLTRQGKEIAAQEAIAEDLRTMLAEIKRIAPLWNPNLDDGVVLTMAPLWRLVPQHRSWQKELKSKWDDLVAGKYDWAHIAMHLWPERVVPKCSTDRSLAIAHGLEDVFWVEGTDGKWKRMTTPTRPVDELVQERTSPAVKAALQSLLDAPVASRPARQRRSRQVNLDA